MADDEKKDEIEKEWELEFDQEQYERLVASSKEDNGCKAWNDWRKQNPNISIKLAGADFNTKKLQNANLSDANLYCSEFIKANLQRVSFTNANLQRANLNNANLKMSYIRLANLQMAKLWDADLTGAILDNTNLHKASLFHVNLEGAVLSHANLSEAILVGAKFRATFLNGANIEKADFREVTIGKEETIYKRRKWQPWRWKKMDDFLYKGFRYLDVSKMAGHTNPSLKREIEDYQFIADFRDSHKFWYPVWLYTSDCGRSLYRWIFCSALLAIIFAVFFLVMGFDSFHAEDHTPTNPFTFFYYSIVTFTTLGFGDITPKTTPAMVVLTIEVILGYFMLGGMISILANKLARRA